MKRIQFKIQQERIRTFWWLFRLTFRIAPLQSTIFVISGFIQTVASILSYYATARVTTSLIAVVSDDVPTDTVWRWFAVVVASSIISNALYRTNHILDRHIYFSLTRWSSLEYAKQLCRIDLKDFYDPEIKGLIIRLSQGFTWQLPNAAYFSLAVTQSVFNTLATVITIGVTAWWLIPVFAVLLIPMLINESRMGNIGWFVFSREGDAQHVFWGIVTTFQDVKKQFEVRALGASKRMMSILTELTDKFYDLQIKEVNKTHATASLAVVTQFMRELIAQGWLLLQVINKQMSVESYLFNVSLVFRLDGAISGLFSTLAQSSEGISFSMDYRKFLSLTPNIVDKDGALVITTAAPSIEFKDVSFRYPGSKKFVFRNFNLSIKAGQKVALVGINGAGKSTIIKLLLRFYSLDKGKILINGTDIRDIAIESLLHQIAVLFQDFNQYTLTARDNIAISDAKPNMKYLDEAARLSGADSIIDDLPEGYDTYLNPTIKGGAELSGGQWQKIALARAFYRKANLLILDEPTSAIDARAEAEIFNNIFVTHDDTTAVIVSHRFSTVRRADKIIVIEKGKVIEQGMHAELIAQKGLYADMFNKQAEGYK